MEIDVQIKMPSDFLPAENQAELLTEILIVAFTEPQPVYNSLIWKQAFRKESFPYFKLLKLHADLIQSLQNTNCSERIEMMLQVYNKMHHPMRTLLRREFPYLLMFMRLPLYTKISTDPVIALVDGQLRKDHFEDEKDYYRLWDVALDMRLFEDDEYHVAEIWDLFKMEDEDPLQPLILLRYEEYTNCETSISK